MKMLNMNWRNSLSLPPGDNALMQWPPNRAEARRILEKHEWYMVWYRGEKTRLW